ncbi:MAG: phosphoribosylglycinamide formyltransferase, partial [Firmicutes bacterium]|nr:phosphoribosylglycinamide formyltransferase [Bacillota bacterium]
MKNISVLVSGGGTNFQAIIDNVESGFIENARIALVISSNPNAFALERAAKHGIKSLVIGKNEYPDMAERTDAIIAALEAENTDLIVL